MTQKNRVLKALKAAGGNGITPADFLAPTVTDGGAPILRLAARILDLKHEGCVIDCDTSGPMATYVLREEAIEVTRPQRHTEVMVMPTPMGGALGAPVDVGGHVGGGSLEEPLSLFEMDDSEDADYYGAAA